MSAALKILFLIETAEPGGAERVVLELARGFRARGYDTSVITLEDGWLVDELKKANLEHSVFRSTRRFDLGLSWKIAQYIRHEGIRILHSHLLDANFYGALAARLAGVPHIATDHGDIHLPSKQVRLKSKLLAMRLLGSQFTAVSSRTRDALVHLGAPNKRTVCIPNPIRLPALLAPVERASQRTALGLNPSSSAEWVWAHVAILFPVKNQILLLKAFAHSLQHSSQKQTLLLIGDGPERESLEACANELGIAQAVRFLGFQNDVGKFLALADGFVLSSDSESLPMALLEAASFSLPLISTNVGGVNEIIDNNTSGLLVPAGDATQLTNAMVSCCSDITRAQRWGAHARKHVEANFSEESVFTRYAELYQSLL